MSKYGIFEKKSSYTDDVEWHNYVSRMFVANELAEANRLKRLELKYRTNTPPEAELEDKA